METVCIKCIGQCVCEYVSLDDAAPSEWDAASKAAYEESLAHQTDGGSATYYKFDIPPFIRHYILETGMIEVRHVIRIMLDNDFDKGNIFKALVRIGEKAGVEPDYDINKSHFFLDCIKEALEN